MIKKLFEIKYKETWRDGDNFGNDYCIFLRYDFVIVEGGSINDFNIDVQGFRNGYD